MSQPHAKLAPLRPPLAPRQRVLRGCWGMLIGAALGSLLLRPHWFTPDHLVWLLMQHADWVWFAYLLGFSLRGLILLPSTPFVLAGSLLFPGQEAQVICAALVCIALSSALIYFWAPVWGLHRHLRPEVSGRIASALQHPGGRVFVAVWAIFPILPSDAISHVAGSLRLGLMRYLIPFLLGKLVLCSLLVSAAGRLHALG